MENLSIIKMVIQVIDIDIQNIPNNGFTSIDKILDYYRNKSESEIKEVYKEYYGTTE